MVHHRHCQCHVTSRLYVELGLDILVGSDGSWQFENFKYLLQPSVSPLELITFIYVFVFVPQNEIVKSFFVRTRIALFSSQLSMTPSGLCTRRSVRLTHAHHISILHFLVPLESFCHGSRTVRLFGLITLCSPLATSQVERRAFL